MPPLVLGTPYESAEEAKRLLSVREAHGASQASAGGGSVLGYSSGGRLPHPEGGAVWPRLEIALSPRVQSEPPTLSPPAMRRGGPRGYSALTLRDVGETRGGLPDGGDARQVGGEGAAEGALNTPPLRRRAEGGKEASPRGKEASPQPHGSSGRRLSRGSGRRGFGSPRASTSVRV